MGIITLNSSKEADSASLSMPLANLISRVMDSVSPAAEHRGFVHKKKEGGLKDLPLLPIEHIKST